LTKQYALVLDELFFHSKVHKKFMNNKAKKKKLPELNKDEYQKLKNYIEKE